MIEPVLIGLLAAGITLFINYCIGSPASGKFSPHEIFSDYTIYLSKERLKIVSLYKQYEQQYNENIKRTEKRHEVLSFQNDFKVMIYNAAEPFFTWERAVGMCPVCTGFWISLITGLIFSFNFIHLVIIIVVSHITIRILNKIL